MYNRRSFVTILILVLLVPLFAACGGGASKSNEPVEVRMTISEFKIDSSLSTFKVGVPYHFVVNSEGALPHEIMLMEPMETSAGMEMEEMDEMALAVVEEEDLPAGGSSTLDYTFTEPAPSGTLEFACHIPGHYEAGMKLAIVVQNN